MRKLCASQSTTFSVPGAPTEAKPIAVYRPFHPDAEAWETWSLQFRGYLGMNLVVEDSIKKSFLVASLAPKCFEELRRAYLSKSPFDFTSVELEALMAKLYGNRVVLLRERSQFSAYSNKLTKRLFKAALVVQFVNGIRNQSVKAKLLAKGKDLTLEDAVNYLQIAEDILREDVKPLNEMIDAQECRAVKALSPKNRLNSSERKCDRCGKDDHDRDRCPFRSFKCFNCGRMGHLLRMCRERKVNMDGKRQQNSGSRRGRRGQRMNHLQSTKIPMLQVYRNGAMSPFTVEVTINGQQNVMELDTGASVTIADVALWQYIGYPTLSSPTVQLRSFTGHVVPLKGETMVSVKCGGQQKRLRIRIAEQFVTNVMGRDWIRAFGGAVPLRTLFVQQASVCHMNSQPSLQGLLNRFAVLFKPGLGHCTKITLSSCFRPARSCRSPVATLRGVGHAIPD
uniref:CCHC-type domain-containing protein n=1 Tax=Trichuris muris TaxID=70415 RepID=A0A5S6QFX3_TRIMR